MNIVEKESKQFVYEFFRGTSICNIDNLKDKLESKLYNFKREKDKLFFLNVLRKEVENEKIKHELKCKTPNCAESEEKETGLFVIDQEIEEISKFYEFEPKQSDKFEIQEQVELHTKLNDIIERLIKLDYGQEIIFNEIDELKEHFNLGKKNWFQLLKGKLFDLTVSKALDEKLVKEIYETLSDGFDNLPDLIDKI
ncbi:MAG: hypothetical protein GQ540_05940 [Lutibacter sp.]|uniref:hypothetical protein n=1 Tax=Lutibacter sp. TaxID=1925666 RepID=UPI0019F67505|nr:hypothetical protein [Lutibacter sp.]NOR28051.1 hypothetical protein [Lutibacter sp.]